MSLLPICTMHTASAAAEDACSKKRINSRYASLERLYHFVPVALEILGSSSTEANCLVGDLGCGFEEVTGDSRSRLFLVQRLAIAIQRGDAASIMGTFAPGTNR
ncbi:hypothetical protein PYW08_000168 [Mythimna loreyi]|uniref:Uncharacterized protein n=1 Tax=Mythimna loreyi TaxID=667449 RepID=A0ACC2RAK6_9NEOP|nr:hypothetical protein PYW08_000168 [Mythimna loreyi]